MTHEEATDLITRTACEIQARGVEPEIVANASMSSMLQVCQHYAGADGLVTWLRSIADDLQALLDAGDCTTTYPTPLH